MASPKEGVLRRVELSDVRAPKPLMPAEIERCLTPRQRQVLDSLETLVVSVELADMTMAQIAAQVNCSLRTLYGILPSKEELVLTILDRRLHRIGRTAIESMDPEESPLVNLRRYLRAAHEAVQPTGGVLSEDYKKTPGHRGLAEAHEKYLVGIVKGLLDQALSQGDIIPIDTWTMAYVLGGLGRDFLSPNVRTEISESPKDAADAALEVIIRGLSTS
ncbi:MAG: hypothetical protein CL917_16185 [Deltaproteobacteria bacterium]|nr:hypothetical protein [Deltaproteobacteria bacterium]